MLLPSFSLLVLYRYFFTAIAEAREIVNICRGPAFGDFYPSNRGLCSTTRRLHDTEYQSTDPLLLPSIKCNVLRESLSEDNQNIPCATLKRRESWVISIYHWLRASSLFCIKKDILGRKKDDQRQTIMLFSSNGQYDKEALNH